MFRLTSSQEWCIILSAYRVPVFRQCIYLFEATDFDAQFDQVLKLMVLVVVEKNGVWWVISWNIMVWMGVSSWCEVMCRTLLGWSLFGIMVNNNNNIIINTFIKRKRQRVSMRCTWQNIMYNIKYTHLCNNSEDTVKNSWKWF